MQFVIATALENKPKYNSFCWSNKYLSDILDFLPCDYNSLSSIQTGILYYCKSHQKFSNALLLKITNVETKPNFLRIYFEIDKTLELQSFLIKDALKKYMNLNSILELPFLSVVDEIKFFDILNNIEISSKIKKLEEQNNWQDIYRIFQTFEPVEKSRIWYDAELLNAFSFSTAKLSECSENLKRKFSDKNQREQFIQEKRKFRELTIKLRKRAIELEPQNPTFYSNLAYTYYQSVNELTTPGSRRDGNIFDEAELALKYLNLALELNPNRLTDLYRKAMLYSDILGTHKFFKQFGEEHTEEKFVDYTSALTESIKCFQKIELIYESFTNEEEIQKQKKIYIKSLYHLAQKFLKLARIKHNYFIQKNKIPAEEAFANLLQANQYIDKCIQKDYGKKKIETEIIEMANCDNFVCGVYKSYLKGTIQLSLYSLKKEKQYAIDSLKFFQLAMETNFPLELRKQNKIFILEKIALLNILQENFSAAIKTLEPIYKKNQNLPPYAAYTLAFAYIENKQIKEAEEIIEKYIMQANDLFKYKFEKLREKMQFKTIPEISISEIADHLYDNSTEEKI
ncbi:MAG: tetratricopeptide repeat protein [Melioribacteraceae bacterium]